MAITKIIKLNNGQTGNNAITYVPVTLASAVQYSYTGGKMSVQDAIGAVATSVISSNNSISDEITSIKTAYNQHKDSKDYLSYNATDGFKLNGIHGVGNIKMVPGTGISFSYTEGGTLTINNSSTNQTQHFDANGATNPTLRLDGGTNGSVQLKGTAAAAGQATVTVSYTSENGIAIKATYTDTKLTSASITAGSQTTIDVTTYSVNVLKGNETISLSGSDGESITGTANYYQLPTQNAIDKAKAEAIAHADNLVISAMNYRGVTSTTLTDGATTKPITINSQSVNPTNGDIVLSGTGADKKEFIWNGTSWNELGDSSAKANKTTKIISDNTAIVVTDETLADDVHIAHETSSAGTTNVTANNKDVTGTSGQQKVITGITVNSYGHVTAYTAANIFSKNTEYNSGNEITIDSSNNINHNTHNVGAVNATDTDITGSGNKQKVITGLTINEYGHITAYTAANIYSTDENVQTHSFTNTAAGTSGNYPLVLSGNSSTVNFVPSNGITLEAKNNNTLTISHTNTGKTKTEALYKIATDAQGHVTTANAASFATAPKGLTCTVYDGTVDNFELPIAGETTTIDLAAVFTPTVN